MEQGAPLVNTRIHMEYTNVIIIYEYNKYHLYNRGTIDKSDRSSTNALPGIEPETFGIEVSLI